MRNEKTDSDLAGAAASLRSAARDRVLTFRQWCAVNAFSEATGRRLIKAGDGPRVLQLSVRRIGIRESDNAAWQASRVRVMADMQQDKLAEDAA